MVKLLTALQCASLLLPSFTSALSIFPPTQLLSIFENQRSDSESQEVDHLSFTPFLQNEADALLNLVDGKPASDSSESIIIIEVDEPADTGFFRNLGSAFDLPVLPSILDQVPKPADVYERLELLVSSRFDAIEQKISSFHEKIKGQLESIIAPQRLEKSQPSFTSTSSKVVESLDDMRYWDVEAWLQSETESEEDLEKWHALRNDYRDHDYNDEHHGHGHEHHHDTPPRGVTEPDSTLLEMIKQGSHTRMFYSFIKHFPDIEKKLDNSEHNITVFAPSDKAFKRIMKGRGTGEMGPPTKDIEKLLQYHIMDGYHDYRGLKWHNTIASEMSESTLGKDEKQRLRIGLYRCPTVNLYSKISVRDNIGKNGVIHVVDAILVPPPDIHKILNLLPTGFSTTLLALHKTGLIHTLERNSMLSDPSKYTVFAPSNSAWEKIPMIITAFLFSEHGKDYLEAVMKYHIVEDSVIYSDGMINDEEDVRGPETHFPAGYHHLSAQSMLTDKKKGEGRDKTGELHIDIIRFPEMLSFRVNGYSDIAVANGIAKDGVIHVPNHIFMPPCQDLPDHGHHDLKRSLDFKVQSTDTGLLDGFSRDFSGESTRCLDFGTEMEDNEETLEKFKQAWERFL